MEVGNRFKGLDLIDRVPDELWMEVRGIVQETGIKTIPKRKKCKKAKWLSEEALQIAVKRREVKSKGEKERYKYLNAEFQRIARRDKKAFLSYQCKEVEENNRMGKTRDLFKKIRDAKGTLHAEMGSIKDRNGMDLTEAEDIKKWWQEYTEEQYGINLTLYAPRNQRVAVSLHRDFCFIAVVWNQTQGFPDGSVGKESCGAGDTSLIPGSGRFLGGRHCNILAWRIPWMEEPGGLQSMGSQRVRHD